MADRCTLAIHKLDEFKAWLDAQGIEHRPTTADYQVLQVQLPGTKGWHAIYQKLDAKVHLTVTGPLVPLVRQFVKGQPAPTVDKQTIKPIAEEAAATLPPWV